MEDGREPREGIQVEKVASDAGPETHLAPTRTVCKVASRDRGSELPRIAPESKQRQHQGKRQALGSLRNQSNQLGGHQIQLEHPSQVNMQSRQTMLEEAHKVLSRGGLKVPDRERYLVLDLRGVHF